MPEGMGEVDAESVAETHKTASYGRGSYKTVPIRKYLTVGYTTGEYPIRKFPIKEYPTGVLHIQRLRILLIDSKLEISSFHKEPTNMIWNTGLEKLPRLFRYL